MPLRAQSNRPRGHSWRASEHWRGRAQQRRCAAEERNGELQEELSSEAVVKSHLHERQEVSATWEQTINGSGVQACLGLCSSV